jgi:hypothetical protein
VTRLLSIGVLLLGVGACAGSGGKGANGPTGELGKPTEDVDPEIVGDAVRDKSGRFQRCFEVARERNPSLAGQVEIRFLINPDGGVGQAQAVETNLPPEVTECVVSAFYSVRLPTRDAAVIAQYPMFFQ